MSSDRLDFVVEQIWGPGIARGEARAILGGQVPHGWEVREQYWVSPSVTGAQLLVPRNRRIAVRTLSDYAGLRRPRARIARRALATAVAGGLPPSKHVLRIIAPVGGAPTVVSELGRRAGLAQTFASSGVRTAANAKPTLELRSASGDAVGFVKLAWNSITTSAVRNEARAMTSLSAGMRPELRAPKVLLDGTIDDRPFVMTEPLPKGIRHTPAVFSSVSEVEALGPGRVVRRRRIVEMGQPRSTEEVLRATSSLTPDPLAHRARALAADILSSQESVPEASFWHGDFVRWNTGRDRDGRLWLFDWETAEAEVPAGLDTLHWYAHVEDAMNPTSVVSRVDGSYQRSLPLLRSLGHSRGSAAATAAWYAVTLVANEIKHAESLGSWERVKHSPAQLQDLLEWGAQRLAGDVLR